MATTVSWLPNVATSWPTKSSRNSRLSRSGAMSTKIRPGTDRSLGSAARVEPPVVGGPARSAGADLLRGRRGGRAPRRPASPSAAAGRRCRRRRRATEPQKKPPSGPSRRATSAAISSGRPGARRGSAAWSSSGATSGSARPSAISGGLDHAGGDGVQPDAGSGPVVAGALVAHPVGDGQLGRRVGRHRAGLVGRPGRRPRRRPGRPRPGGGDTGLDGRRVGADGDRRRPGRRPPAEAGGHRGGRPSRSS